MGTYNREEIVCQSLGLSHVKILSRDPITTISLVRDDRGNPATLKVIATFDEAARDALQREVYWLRHPPFRYPVRMPRLIEAGSDYIIKDMPEQRLLRESNLHSGRLQVLLDLYLDQLARTRIPSPPGQPWVRPEESQLGVRSFMKIALHLYPELISLAQLRTLFWLHANGHLVFEGSGWPANGNVTLRNLRIDEEDGSIVLLDFASFDPQQTPFKDLCQLCCEGSESMWDWTWQRFLIRRHFRRVARRTRGTTAREALVGSLRLHLALECMKKLIERGFYDNILPHADGHGIARLLGKCINSHMGFRSRNPAVGLARLRAEGPSEMMRIWLQNLSLVLSAPAFGEWFDSVGIDTYRPPAWEDPARDAAAACNAAGGEAGRGGLRPTP